MAYLPLVGAPLTALGYTLDSVPPLKLAKFYFSEEFGPENRVKYLNYIHKENVKPGRYERTVAYLNEHPQLARRLIITTELALRALEISGALMCASAAITALGLASTPALVLTCVAISPLVTKALAEMCPCFEGIDSKFNTMVLLASCISAFIGLFPFSFMEIEFIRELAILDVMVPAGFGIIKSSDNSIKPKEYWNKYFELMALQDQLKGEMKVEDIDREYRKLQFTLNSEFNGGLLPLKQSLLERLEELQIERHGNIIGGKGAVLVEKIHKSNFEDPSVIIKLKDDLRDLIKVDMLKYCEAKLALLKKSATSGRFSEETMKSMKDHFANDIILIGNIISHVGDFYMEKALANYKHHEDILKQTNPNENYRLFIKSYETCLAMQDPFEISEVTNSYIQMRLRFNMFEGWLMRVSNEPIRNILESLMIRSICPNMIVNTMKLQKENEGNLKIALQHSRRN